MEGAEAAATLRLLAGLLAPCVALLALLAALLLLRHRHGSPPAAAAAPRWPPPLPCACGRRQPRGPPACRPPPAAAAAAASRSPSSEPEPRPPRVPPNSPAGSWSTPDGAFSGHHTGTQRKMLSCRPAFPTCSNPVPFEYGSSIRRGDHKWTLLNSANFTASQGPGLDSDFGASAGVSLRILSSDSEESPTTPLLHPQQSGRFEWDYYDPSYKKSTQLPCHLPCICSKQYWL